ncbi:hypothetical protein K437DRAFT_266667, partial [Tilletiaria anomala UBC 951]
LSSLLGGSTSPLSGLLGQAQGQLGGSTNPLIGLLGGSTSQLSGLLGQAQGQLGGAQSTLNGLLGNLPVSTSSVESQLRGLTGNMGLGGAQSQLGSLTGALSNPSTTQSTLNGLTSQLGLSSITSLLPLQFQQQQQQPINTLTGSVGSHINSLPAHIGVPGAESNLDAAKGLNSDVGSNAFPASVPTTSSESTEQLQTQINQMAKMLNVNPNTLLSQLTSGAGSGSSALNQLLSQVGTNNLQGQLSSITGGLPLNQLLPGQLTGALSGVVSGPQSSNSLAGLTGTVSSVTNGLPLSGLTSNLPIGGLANTASGLTAALPNIGTGLLGGLLGTHLPLNLQQQVGNRSSHVNDTIASIRPLSTTNTTPLGTFNGTAIANASAPVQMPPSIVPLAAEMPHGTSSMLRATTVVPTLLAASASAAPTALSNVSDVIPTPSAWSVAPISLPTPAQSFIAYVSQYTDKAMDPTSTWTASLAAPTILHASKLPSSPSSALVSTKDASNGAASGGASDKNTVPSSSNPKQDTSSSSSTTTTSNSTPTASSKAIAERDDMGFSLPPGTKPYPTEAIVYPSSSAVARHRRFHKAAGRGLGFRH